MSPEEKQQFDEMKKQLEEAKKQIAALSNVSSTDFMERIVDSRVKKVTSVTDADVTLAQSVSGGGGGSVNILDFPDRWKVEQYKGSLYRTPLYLESRF